MDQPTRDENPLYLQIEILREIRDKIDDKLTDAFATEDKTDDAKNETLGRVRAYAVSICIVRERIRELEKKWYKELNVVYPATMDEFEREMSNE